MPAYTFYYTQNKISHIPNELINDIKQLFINIYMENLNLMKYME